MTAKPSSAPRIGVFGGSFDPPHKAHVALARAAIEQLELDSLHVIPTGQAWHKARALSDAQHRLAMTQLAFSDVARVVVDDRELKRSGPTFTIDTLLALQVENPQAQLYLFIGADQLAAFQQWQRWSDILDIAIICIADRTQSILASTSIDSQFDAYQGRRERFVTLTLPLMPISATLIRELLSSGADAARGITQLVPEAVARYIAAHQLYGPVQS